MEITQLKYFKTVVELGSLSKAAERLYVSAPAISSSISRLEKELGTTLFDREKRLVLNERGKVFLVYVNQILNAVDNSKIALSEFDEVKSCTVSVGVASETVWSNLFADFSGQFPDITLDQQFINLNTIKTDDVLTKYDFVIAAPGDLSVEKLHSVELYNDDIPYLMVSKNHPFAKRKRIALIDAKDEKFIALTKGTSSRRYFDTLFSIAGFSPKIVSEGTPTLRSVFVAENRGLGLATAHSKFTNTNPNIRFIEICDPFYRRSQSLYWHEDRYRTVAAKLFEEFAINYFKNGCAGVYVNGKNKPQNKALYK